MEQTLSSVHLLPTYPVVYRASSAKVRYNGYYDATREATDFLGVSRYCAEPHLVFAHETGHRIEQRGLTAVDAVYFASWEDSALGEWRAAVIQSRCIAREMPYFRRFGTAGEKRMVDYLMLPQELWARSYAQYVTVKSQSPEMLTELRSLQQDILQGDSVPSQWQEADFAAISGTIDRLFKAKGWIP